MADTHEIAPFPSQIDMSWAGAFPADSAVGGHLEEYVRARVDWAEATQLAWGRQENALQRIAEANADLGIAAGRPDQILASHPSTEVNVGRGSQPNLQPQYLGRTSLRHMSSLREPRGDTSFYGYADLVQAGGLEYTYGRGPLAERAKLLEQVMVNYAELAAHSILGDSQIDAATATVWSLMLKAGDNVAVFDPEAYAQPVLTMLGAARERLSEEPPILDVRPDRWGKVTFVAAPTSRLDVTRGRGIAFSHDKGVRVEHVGDAEPFFSVTGQGFVRHPLIPEAELSVRPERSFKLLRTLAGETPPEEREVFVLSDDTDRTAIRTRSGDKTDEVWDAAALIAMRQADLDPPRLNVPEQHRLTKSLISWIIAEGTSIAELTKRRDQSRKRDKLASLDRNLDMARPYIEATRTDAGQFDRELRMRAGRVDDRPKHLETYIARAMATLFHSKIKGEQVDPS